MAEMHMETSAPYDERDMPYNESEASPTGRRPSRLASQVSRIRRPIRKLKLVVSFFTILICIFDLGSDWYLFTDFYSFGVSALDWHVSISLAVSCGASSILFFLELRNGAMAVHKYRNDPDAEDVNSSANRKLERWQEVVTFLQLLIEDLPINIMLYITFREASCPLFLRIFESSFAGDLALLAAFVSSLWKMVTALLYCCCGGYKGIKSRGGWRHCCCCQRTFRAMLALLLCGCTAFLYFTFEARGVEVREDCLLTANGTAMELALTALPTGEPNPTFSTRFMTTTHIGRSTRRLTPTPTLV